MRQGWHPFPGIARAGMPSLPPGRPAFAPLAPGGIVQDAEAAQLGWQVKEIPGYRQAFVSIQGQVAILAVDGAAAAAKRSKPDVF
jgi:hypothetical protein